MALDSKLLVSAVATQTKSSDLATASEPLTLTSRIALANGTGANQADRIWHDKRTIAASATDALDLAGVLVDAFGATVTFAKIKAIVIEAAAANVNNVNVVRDGTNGVPLFLAAGDGIPVLPGGVFAWVAPGAGVAVTPGTGDLLNLVNSGAGSSVDCNVLIIGTSA